MFCPSCGLEERQSNQFCRACGSNLSIVRGALEKPDNITQSAVTARDEIGRAIATKIRETSKLSDFAEVAEDLLPEIEKFLESPEEKRLRRIRNGTILTSIGLGAAIAFSMISFFFKDDFMIFAGMGVVAFSIGLSLILNAMLFTVPKKRLPDRSPKADAQRELDAQTTNELVLPQSREVFSSVTESTTRHLKEKQPLPPK